MKRYKLLWVIIKRCNADKVIFAFVANIFIVALIVTLAEPDITKYGDGLWYTFVACTTIGFGDYAAATAIGRIATIYMVINEIVLVGILPGVVVSYYMEVIHRRQQETVTVFLDKLERLPELSKEELEDLSYKVKSYKL